MEHAKPLTDDPPMLEWAASQALLVAYINAGAFPLQVALLRVRERAPVLAKTAKKLCPTLALAFPDADVPGLRAWKAQLVARQHQDSKPILRGILEDLKVQGPDSPKQGICSAVVTANGRLPWDFYLDAWCRPLMDAFHRIVETWPRYSGDPSYPVPGAYPWEAPPARAYNLSPNKWDRSTEYGRARWELVEYVIQKLEAET